MAKQVQPRETLPEFEQLRQQVRQRARVAGRESAGAVRRRLAALGGLSGGAGIKLEAQARERAEALGEQAATGIGLQEAREVRQKQQREQEIEAQRAFAREEAKVGREFAAEQAGLGREFTARQAGIGREFAKEQALASRAFAKEQSVLQREFVSRESEVDRQFRSEQASAQLDLARQQLEIEKDVAAFNKAVAGWQMGQPTDLFGQLLGPQFSSKKTLGGVGIGAGAGFLVGGPVGAAVGGAIGGVICFLKGTVFKMVDGLKAVEDIELGDVMERGGKVFTMGKALSEDVYRLDDVYVTGSHAYFNGDKWMRVKDVPGIEKIEGEHIVYIIGNENHRMIHKNDKVFADVFEVNGGENLTEAEKIQALNEGK